jgi:hypothetical protein
MLSNENSKQTNKQLVSEGRVHWFMKWALDWFMGFAGKIVRETED